MRSHHLLVPRQGGVIPPLGTKLLLMPGHCDPVRARDRGGGRRAHGGGVTSAAAPARLTPEQKTANVEAFLGDYRRTSRDLLAMSPVQVADCDPPETTVLFLDRPPSSSARRTSTVSSRR